MQVIKRGRGVLATYRRSNGNHKPHEYVPCEFCYAFVLSNLLYSHAKTCTHKPDNAQPEANYYRNACAMIAPFLRSLDDEDDEIVMETNALLDSLRETQLHPGVARICQNDPLIKEYAISLVEKMGEKHERRIRDQDNSRNKIRTLGKMLKELNKTSDCWNDLSSFLSGKRFRDVVAAVKSLSKSSDSPQFALTAGHYIKQVNLMKISLAIEAEDERMKREAKNFKHMYEANWNTKVSSVALRRQKLRQINKEEMLPMTVDLICFKKWLCQILENKPDMPDEKSVARVAKATLARLLIFNKLRIGEVEELKVFDFLNRPNDVVPDEIMKCLTVSERMLAKTMHVVQVRGKSTRGIRKVHLVISPDVQEAIEYVLKHRKITSQYVFARNSEKPMDGCQIIRELTAECPGLKYPALIRSRQLRKYIATTTQINDMSEHDLKRISDHLGHNYNIHTDVYCLQSSLLQRTKVARILIAVENGCVQSLSGKSLEEIDIDALPMPIDYNDEWETPDDDSVERVDREPLSAVQENSNNESNVHDSTTEDSRPQSEADDDEEAILSHQETQRCKVRNNMIRRERKKWTVDENHAIWMAFKSAVMARKNVTSKEITAAKEKFPVLEGRAEMTIRVKVNNIIKGKQQFDHMKYSWSTFFYAIFSQ